jgi:hypothetical protein
MNTRTLETWTWVLIYGGLLVLCLGMAAQQQGHAIGCALIVLGSVLVVVGGVLIFLRSRAKPE